jgi:glycosyltransferase involved in cell wall biosynthesis
MSIHLDISELVAHPLRSGIQRVEREAIRHWPAPARPIPCIVDAQGIVRELAPRALDVLCAADDGRPASRSTERKTLARLAAESKPLADTAIKRFLNLELFLDPVRAETHIRLAARGVTVLWYLYDFIPFLRPEFFSQGTARHFMPFLRALRGVGDRLAFLSEATRSDYRSRIARGRSLVPDAPVIDPGADGLGLERQIFSPNRRTFVSIGTVEPRKNTAALLHAFERLWERGLHAPLVMAGRVAASAEEALAFFDQHRGNKLLTVLDHPSDERLRQALRNARAVVMPSEVEGFGLPPYEALHAGIPAVASAALPSAALMPAGALLLQRMDAAAIAAAVETLLDDAVAMRLWTAAETLRLPRWVDFGRKLAEWAQTA